MTKERIAVIFGGQSPEHDVSIVSAQTVLGHLNPARYDIIPIYVTRHGRWVFPPQAPGEASYALAVDLLLAGAGSIAGPHSSAFADLDAPVAPSPATLQHMKDMGVTLAWILIHGQGGEDGILQRALEDAGMPFVGSGPEASELCMDKRRTLDVLAAAGLTVPQGCVFLREGDLWRNVKRPDEALALQDVAAHMRFLPPWVVKPNCGGSSVGVTIVTNAMALGAALLTAAEIDDLVIVETCITGAEVTCGVLERWDGGAGRLFDQALPPTRIIPRHSAFFDYNSKYVAGETMEITPANVEPETIERIQAAALRAHTALGCRGLSRTDIIVQDGVPFILEVNTIPGMTPTSLLPQGAAAIGIEFADLIDLMIQAALIDAAAPRRLTALRRARAGAPSIIGH